MVSMIANKFRIAFTLAEVLITLGIIGVVSILTIPILINNIDEKYYITAYKKAFSVANQAWARADVDSLIVPMPSWIDQPSRVTNFNAFKSYFVVSKDCNNSNNSECWDVTGEKFYNAFPDSSAFAFIDSSGFAWTINSSTGSTGPEILVDINAFKKPNKFGYDRFVLWPSVYSTAGMPTKIVAPPDITSFDGNMCPSGNLHPCSYTTWLLK